MDKELERAFLWTLAPEPEPRRQAEAFLATASERPDFGMEVLKLVEQSTDDQARQAAAVGFKNHVKFKWNPADQEAAQIQAPEKEQIKSCIVAVMLQSPPLIQSQLSEALAIISTHDFPEKWEKLLPDLVKHLNSVAAQAPPNFVIINGILQTLNAMFKKFRYGYKSMELYRDLKYCLNHFAEPLLRIFTQTGLAIRGTQDVAALKPLFECQRLCCRIFYSLNSHELPEFFEDHMQEWMAEFQFFLGYNNPALNNDPASPSVVDLVKTAICMNINLYVEKNEEEFQGFLQAFATIVWQLLTHPAHDQLAMSAMRFLTTVSRGVHHTLFSDPQTLQQICQSIAIPNVRVRDEDEELFEMNPLEYIRRDVEGSDQDTRRRAACELIKGLMVHYRQPVTSLIATYIQGLVTSFSANPAQNWRDKDTAVYLIVALAQRDSETGLVSTDLVPLDQFLQLQAVPELQAPDVNSQPMLKADALKLITTFRSKMSKEMILALLPQLIRFLVAESNVVHSYAAGCAEKLLLVKDGRVARVTPADLTPFQNQLLSNLLAALQLPESGENPYVMKCIMRVLSVAEVGPVSLHYLNGLIGVLTSVCNNPTNPTFNHYIFESVAALVRKACRNDQEIAMAFEQKLFPVFEFILQRDVVEFQPYSFQILAQLIDLRPAPVPPAYSEIFKILLDPALWKKSANVPAIVRFLQAFLLKGAQQITPELLQKVVNVFGSLVSKKSSEDHAMFIGNTMVESLSTDVLLQYAPHLWAAIFTRLQNTALQTVKFLKLFIIFVSLFVVKHGQAVVVSSVNSVSPAQPALFTAIVEQFWIRALPNISGGLEVKLCAVASTNLLCDSGVLLGSNQLWGGMLNSVLSLLVKPEEQRIQDDDDVPEMDQVSSYSGTYARLHNAGKKEDDPLPEIRDAKEYLCKSLNRLSMQFPGKFPVIILQLLEPENNDALRQLCNTYSTTIV